MNLKDFYIYYSEGDRLYNGVLRRNLNKIDKNKDINEIKDQLVSEGYFKRYSSFRCPECDYLMFDTSQDFAEDYLKEKETFCNGCGELIRVSSLIVEPILVRTNKTYEDENVLSFVNKSDFKYKYDYGKVCRDLNKIQKEIFEQKKKEPERNVKIIIKLSNGESMEIDNPVKFNCLEIV